ncbi:hypothetical protein FRACYDRAFT_240689 [Fragilariopsis cylindrus CCMP1102]|uniref:Uncharacterized protein n=1 Tax=Fragilariopsis cylindrus CCMP1102 TaxID=635003 RepID=A0A1E7FCU5_9STRA|nr:hypothetical protein FRACYDRAFT_240689 [Fragilariopsis cylindrus CCMP1102]|eukprot:OEU15990.1 hypothetical protein FRACYDRAFT_240689 [Fragilariopsis cylindrus CCMP1102]
MILTSSTLLSNSALKKVVKAPHIIANALDWKIGVGIPATVLTIDVYTDRIGLALATVDHDKQQQQQSNNCTGRTKYDQLTTRTAAAAAAAVTNRTYFSCKVLDSIPLFPPSTNNKRRTRNNNDNSKKKKRIAVSPEDKYRLLRLVQEHSISGFIVSWPLQKDTGLMGASCGRTLFTIEQLLLENDEEEKDYDNKYTKIFTPNRPICFWDGGMHNINSNHNNKTDQQEQEQPQPDIFGRCSIYARTSTRKEHRASKEQYYPQNEFSTMNAMKVWEDFYQTHWPITTTHNKNNNSDGVDNDTIMQKQQRQEKQIKEEQQQEQLQQERERENNHHVNYPTHNNSNKNTLNRNDDVFRFSSLVQQPNNNSDSNNNDNNNDSNSNPELLSSPYISTRRRRTLAATSSLVSMA